MKNRWLLLAIAAILAAWAESFSYQCLLGVLFLIYWQIRFKDHTILYLLALLVLMMIPKQQGPWPKSDLGTIVRINANSIWIKIEGEIYLTYDIEQVNYGDIVQFNGDYSALKATSSFFGTDLEHWAQSNGIKGAIHLKDYHVLEKGKGVKNFFYGRIDCLNDAELKSFFKKVLFNEEDGGIVEEYSMLQLIQSSGSHLSLTLRLAQSLLSIVLYPEWVDGLLLFFLIGTVATCDMSITLLRLLLSRMLVFIKDKDDRLGWLILLMLMYNRAVIYNLAFQIPIFLRFIRLFAPKRHFYDSALAILPIQLSAFYKADLFQLCLFPILRYIFYLGWILSIASLVLDRYGFIHVYLNMLTRLYAHIPKQITTGNPNLLWLIVWVIVLSNHFLRRKGRDFAALAALLLINQYQAYFSPFTEFVLLNVGQGDCMIIRFPFSNRAVMIDTGPPSSYQRVASYLDANGLMRIDALVLTHHDDDHAGNMERLRHDYDVGQVHDRKKPYLKVAAMTMTVLLADCVFTNTNDNSLVLIFEINGLRFLIAGDISRIVERELMRRYPKLGVDIVKIAHHGSSTSSSDLFLSATRSKLALISCGSFNLYHHPSQSVIDRLQGYRIPYLVTASSGDIRIVSWRFHHFVVTSRNEFGIIQ